VIATLEAPGAGVRPRRLPRREWLWVAGGCAGFGLAVALHSWFGALHTEIAVLAAMVTLPGWLLLGALGIRVTWSARGVVYAVTSSLAVLTAVALLAGVVLAPLGVSAPLAALPYTATLLAACLALAAIALRPGGPGLTASWPVIADGARRHWLLAFAWPAGVPLLGAAATLSLDAHDRAWPIWAVVVLTGLLLLGAVFTAHTVDGQRMTPFVLYGVALTLLWSYSLRTSGLFGFDVRQEYANYSLVDAARHWVPVPGDPYAAMLSITALPVAISQVTGISGLILFKVVYPALFALFPVGLYGFSRRWLGPAAALAVSCLVVLQASFPQQMSALCRQEIALLLFIGMVQAAVDSERVTTIRGPLQVLTAVLGSAMALSHYSTTYVAVSALIGWRILSLGTRRRAGLGEWTVVAVIVSVTAIWYGPVTQSASNLVSAASSLVSGHLEGAQQAAPAPASSPATGRGGAGARPVSNGGSEDRTWLTSWLSSTAVSYVPVTQYADAVGALYQQQHSWVEPYPVSQLRTYRLVDDPAPTVAPVLRGAELLQPLTTLMRQLVNGASVLAVLWFAFQAIRRRHGPYELAAIALPFVAIAVAARVSPSIAFIYNPERLALQTSTITALPLAVLVERLIRQRRARHRRVPIPLQVVVPTLGRRPRRDLVVTAVFAAVLGIMGLGYLDASGIGARLAGGDPPGNLSAIGEVPERLDTTTADVMAARWIGRSIPKDAILNADRYGALQLLAYGGGGHDNSLPDLVPGTIDRRAYVYATRVNIVLGRARGATPDGSQFANFAFPRAFLDRYAAVIYDTGTARVYR
jgi:uncharacterized membrane protein